MYRLLLILVAFVMSLTVSAQERPPSGGEGHEGGSDKDAKWENMPKDGTMTGIVKDPEGGVAVEYANIVLYNMRDTSLVTGTLANSDGKFFLENLPYGRYIVEVNFIGYNKKWIPGVKINPKTKDIDLGVIEIKQAVTNIGEVEIVGERKYIEYKIDKKVVNVGQDITSEGGTAADVLQNTPSIQTDLDGNVSLRGSTNFTVLIDGKPTILDVSEVLQQIPASSIEQIEIITNPSAKYDPDGVAGIINIILKKQREKGFSGLLNVDGGRGPVYGGDVLLNYRIGNLNLFVGGDYRVRTRPSRDYNERETYINDTTFYMISRGNHDRVRGGNSVKAGIEYNVTKKDYLSLAGSAGNRGFGMNRETQYDIYTFPETSHSYSIRDSEFDVNNNSLTADAYYQHKFSGKSHLLSATAQYSRNIGHDTDKLSEYDTDIYYISIDDNPDIQRSIEDEKKLQSLLKVDYEKAFGENGKLEAGYQFSYYQGGGEYNMENYNTDPDIWVVDSTRYNDIDFYRNIQAVYGTFTNKLLGFDFMLGLRGEYTDRVIKQNVIDTSYRVNRFDVFPTCHISRPINEKLQAQASYSRRINRPREYFLDPFPNYSDSYTVRMGNPALEPEYVDSYEAGLQYRFGKNFLSLEGYHRKTNNKINRVSTLGANNIMIQTFANLDSDRATGAELMANLELYKWWTLNISGDAFVYHIEGQVVETDVSQTINTWSSRVSSTFKLKWGTNIQVSASYEAPSLTAQGKRSAEFESDAAIRQDFFKRQLSVSFRVRDIFGTTSESDTAYGPGFYTYNKRSPVAPMFQFSVTYRINNYKSKKRERGGEGGMDGDGEGMD